MHIALRNKSREITEIILSNPKNSKYLYKPNKVLTEVGENTVLKEISHYSAMFTYAQKELFLLDENPWMQITKPKKPKARDRRIHPSEIELILKALDYEHGRQPVLSQHFVAWAFLFALETAMRRGEILGIEKKDIYDEY